MSENVTFRGASLRSFDVRQGREGAAQVFVRIHMSADYNEQVCERLDWEYLPDCALTADLSGALNAINFILTPGDKQLKKYELNFDISSVEDFKLKSKKADGDDDDRERRLEFTVLTPKEGVEAFLGDYIRRVGRHEGQLKIGYSVQDKLPLEETKAAKPTEPDTDDEDDDLDTNCVSCNNRLPFEDAGKTTHANGAKCTAAGSSTVASAREAAGGTHAKGKRGRLAKAAGPEISDEEAAARVN